MPGLKDIPQVVAEVNGHPIQCNDLLRELVGSGAQRAIDSLVRRKLVEEGAKAAKVTVTDEEIERQFKVDRLDLMNELVQMPWEKKYKEFPIAEIIKARYFMSVEEYKQTVVREKLLVRRCVAKDIQPTEAQLLKFFNDYTALFQPPAKYHASHILISPINPRDFYRGLRFRSPIAQMQAIEKERRERIDLKRDDNIDLSKAPSVADVDPAWENSRLKAQDILNKINAKQISWDQAVRKFSQDPLDQPEVNHTTGIKGPSVREHAQLPPGDVGWFHSGGPLVKEFYLGAKDLRPNEIGGPVRTEYGFHLIKMIKIENEVKVAFEDCKAKVERFFLEDQIQKLSEKWLQEQVDRADLKTERALLWPPAPARAQVRAFDIPRNEEHGNEQADPDPEIGKVNGIPLHRSEVWRQLLRTDGDDALNRLINLEVIMRMLKNMGVERMDWECSDPERRANPPPRTRPIRVNADAVDLELNDDRLRHDSDAPDLSFSDYVYQRYGQSVDEYKRKLEARLVLREAIRQKIPLDEPTLRVEFALAREQYGDPAWYDISHILIVPTGGMDKANDNARGQAKILADFVAEQCVANAAKPTGFQELVRQWSMDTDQNKARGGKLGACHADNRDPDIPAEIYGEIEKQKLEPGQFSVPIRTSKGYHIVRIDSKHAARPADFKEARPRLEHDYLQERAKMYSDLWLQALTTQATIKRYLFAPANPVENDPVPDNFHVPKT